ncbi:MAG: EfeM/EfeO family lipoprotein [Arsenophonus sp.]
MHSFAKKILIFLSGLTLFISIIRLIFIKEPHYNVQIIDKNIIAKGNIQTDEKYCKSIKSYLNFVIMESNSMILKLDILEKKLKSGDLKKAQKNYIQAHHHYEAIRPIIILFRNIDRIINVRSDYFLNGVIDYRFKGFHLIEYQLFIRKNIKEALNATNQLLINLRDLKKRISIENLDIIDLIQASSDFIEMILKTKLIGKENIYSLSDLNDIAANLRGSKEAVMVLSPFIEKKILFPILQNYKKSNDILSRYKLPGGEYKSHNQLSTKDKMAFYSILSQQAEFLSVLRSQLDVNLYHKY